MSIYIILVCDYPYCTILTHCTVYDVGMCERIEIPQSPHLMYINKYRNPGRHSWADDRK